MGMYCYLRRASREDVAPERMMALEIYPEVRDRASEGEESELGWLLGAFTDLRDEVAQACDAGECVVVYAS